MSGDGDELRKYAIKGAADLLKEDIVKRANTCSQDEYGLTALHYAVLNGHTECVKLLIANSWGVSSLGIKCRCMNLISTMGLTALHLAASECPRIRAKDITLLLLIVGTDISIRSAEGKTAHQMALESGNTAVLSAYEEFNSVRLGKDPVLKTKFQKQVSQLKTQYTFQITTKTRGTVHIKDIKQHFEIPDFLLEEQDHAGNIPEELIIHEHHIKALANVGFTEMTGTEALQCLEFTREQAIANLHRREQVMKSTDAYGNFEPADPHLYSI